jgi:hypothetical protein
MRNPAPALLLIAAACGSTPDPQETSAEAPDAVVMKLRDGEAPATLKNDKNPAWLVEIGKALTEDRPWKSDADAFGALLHFATHAGPAEIPAIEALLADPKPAQRMRGLLILRLSPGTETRELLERRAAGVLDPSSRDVAAVALGAMGYRKARGATEAILNYLDATDEPAALAALGRIWEGAGEDALRTAVLLVAHSQAMSPSGTTESVGALLRVMTDAELEDFIAKWVPERFGSRAHVVAVAGDKQFNRARGRRLHEAFLKSPDADLVVTILWTSPHRLDAAAVKPLLANEAATEGGARVCDYAAARLEADDSGLPPDLPADQGQRERRLKKWRGR